MTLLFIALLAVPVAAVDLTAPEVPDSGRALMPSDTETFGEGLLEVLRDALGYFQPDLKEAAGICFGVIAAVMVVSILQSLPGSTGKTERAFRCGSC